MLPGGPGGGSDEDVPVLRVSFSPTFQESVIKRSQFFWCQLSKHFKRGNSVRPSPICVFEYTFDQFV